MHLPERVVPASRLSSTTLADQREDFVQMKTDIMERDSRKSHQSMLSRSVSSSHDVQGDLMASVLDQFAAW